MPEEQNNKINDILNKLDQFIESHDINPLQPTFTSKPQYVLAIENEIELQKLAEGKYIKVPFNPLTQTFSELVLYYFLAQDGILKKYPNLSVSPISFSGSIRYIKGIAVNDWNFNYVIINLGKPFVFIARTTVNEINNLFADADNELISAIENNLDAKYLGQLCDNNGCLNFYGASLKSVDFTVRNMNKIMTSTVSEPWTKATIVVDISKINKTYPITIYYKWNYKTKEDYILVYIPAFILQDYFEFVFLNYFKEKKT